MPHIVRRRLALQRYNVFSIAPAAVTIADKAAIIPLGDSAMRRTKNSIAENANERANV
jgi:hypothetical protein